MTPTCTPEKKNDYLADKQLSSNLNELYFTTNEFQDLKLVPKDDRDEERKQIAALAKTFPDLDKIFFLHKRVGFGTFSTVYLASLKADDTFQKRFAIKHVVPTCHPNRIKFELKCLKEIGGKDNVVGIDMCLRNQNNIVFVMPYQPHDCFSDYVGEMDAKELVSYMKNLLTAVAHVHKFNIVHRDIKPSNFLCDRKNKRYLLVDFGLAHSVTKKPDPDDELKRKRKRDLLSPTANEVTQESKRLHHSKTSENITNEIKQGTSQKENNLQENGTKVFSRNFPLASRTIFFQDLSNKKKTTPNRIMLTKVPSTSLKQSVTTRTLMQRNSNSQLCKCYGKAKTCTHCLVKKNLRALRAGTPGFRSPEVLLRSTEQDTAVDIWAAGTIMLSILSNCCNFFASPDDLTALGEIILIFGYEEVRKLARECGRYLICSEKNRPLDLRKICCILRARGRISKLPSVTQKCTDCHQSESLCVCVGKPLHESIQDNFPDTAYDLLKQLLDINPKTRISAKNALEHPFFKEL